jgi:biopolymer transport protein ExbD
VKLVRPGQRDSGLARLPITSLIDIVFLLLIYFMVTTTLTPSESDVSSALSSERQQGGAAADFEPQVVTVDAQDGQAVFHIGDRAVTDQRELTVLLTALPKEGGVFIRGMDRAPVWAIAAAKQAAVDAGFTKRTYVPAHE